MSQGFNSMTDPGAYLEHHGIKGQKWGERRFQNEDGSWTAAGRERYGKGGAPKATLSDVALAIGPTKRLKDAYPTRSSVDLNRNYANHSPDKKTSFREKIDYAKTKRLLSEEVDWMGSDAIAWEKDHHSDRSTSAREAYLNTIGTDKDDITSEQFIAGFGLALMNDLGIKNTDANMTEVANFYSSHVKINEEMTGINLGTVQMNAAYNVYRDMALRSKVHEMMNKPMGERQSDRLDQWLEQRVGTETIRDIAQAYTHSLIDSDSYYDNVKRIPENISDEIFWPKAYEIMGYPNGKQRYEALKSSEQAPEDVAYVASSLRRMSEDYAVYVTEELDKLRETKPLAADVVKNSFKITSDPKNKNLNFEQLCDKIRETAGKDRWNGDVFDMVSAARPKLGAYNRDFAKKQDEYESKKDKLYADMYDKYKELKSTYRNQGLDDEAIANKIYKQLITMAPNSEEYPSLYNAVENEAWQLAQNSYDKD